MNSSVLSSGSSSASFPTNCLTTCVNIMLRMKILLVVGKTHLAAVVHNEIGKLSSNQILRTFLEVQVEDVRLPRMMVTFAIVTVNSSLSLLQSVYVKLEGDLYWLAE